MGVPRFVKTMVPEDPPSRRERLRLAAGYRAGGGGFRTLRSSGTGRSGAWVLWREVDGWLVGREERSGARYRFARYRACPGSGSSCSGDAGACVLWCEERHGEGPAPVRVSCGERLGTVCGCGDRELMVIWDGEVTVSQVGVGSVMFVREGDAARFLHLAGRDGGGR